MLTDFAQFHALGCALTAAQARTRDHALSVVHAGGRVQIVRTGWRRGAVDLKPVAGPLPFADAVAYLDALG